MGYWVTYWPEDYWPDGYFPGYEPGGDVEVGLVGLTLTSSAGVMTAMKDAAGAYFRTMRHMPRRLDAEVTLPGMIIASRAGRIVAEVTIVPVTVAPLKGVKMQAIHGKIKAEKTINTLADEDDAIAALLLVA